MGGKVGDDLSVSDVNTDNFISRPLETLAYRGSDA